MVFENLMREPWATLEVTGTGDALSRRDRIALRVMRDLMRHPDYRDSPVQDVADDAVMHADALLVALDGEPEEGGAHDGE